MQTFTRRLPKSFSITNIRQNPDMENKASEERIPKRRRACRGSGLLQGFNPTFALY